MPAAILDIRNPDDRADAAAAIADGAVAACAYNGIYTLVGDADDPRVPGRATAAKGRSESQGLALVCPPEHFDEHVRPDAGTLASNDAFARVQDLYRSVHAVGVILPAAADAPAHLVQSETILNVWTEERPESPLRELVRELRARGRRALAGTSANRTGEPTITTAGEVVAVFANRVDVILLDDFSHVPEARRRSASIVDLSGTAPRLARLGSVPAAELAAELRRLGFGELQIPADVRRV
jgi:tRNA A37 threonylcarbamoyladenosine synthetase subunit TsaC/SUA5/YrdC